MNDAWVTTLDSARARWKTADAAERAAITAELDAAWATLSDEEREEAASDPEMNEAPVHSGPRFGSVRALLTWNRVWQAEAFGAH